MKIFEGINSLLKYFHYRNAANIFHSLLIHCFQRRHILTHKLRVISAHHPFQKKDTDPHRYQAANTQPPIKKKNQNHDSDRHNNGSSQIWQLMGQKPFCQSRIVINDLSQPPTCILAEISQWQRDNMMDCLFSHIGCCAKCRQMRAVQRDKINKNTRCRKTSCHPRIMSTFRCKRYIPGSKSPE